MPDKLDLKQNWLFENVRSAVESFKLLHVSSDQHLSDEDYSRLISIAFKDNIGSADQIAEFVQAN